MTTTTNPLASRIATMTTDQICDLLGMLNQKWNEYTTEERTVRSHLLSEYERRMGGEAVDALMDKLDAQLAS